MTDFQSNLTENAAKPKGRPIVLTILGAIGVVSAGLVGVIVAARVFMFEVRYIPSKSMLPTLQVNDRILIDKLIYRSQVPKRGDIVIFSPTETLKQQNFHDAFVKRIIGLPGETIEVKQGKVYINNQSLSEPYIKDPAQYQYGPITVPADQYFVLGDSRNNAYDSHYWGFVPRGLIFGKATQIILPREHSRSLN